MTRTQFLWSQVEDSGGTRAKVSMRPGRTSHGFWGRVTGTFCQKPSGDFWGKILWVLRIGEARHPGLRSLPIQ